MPDAIGKGLLTQKQTQLARHALGLTNKRLSYRNRFCAVNRTRDWCDFRAIVDAGLAWRVPWGWDGGDLFGLTRAGAESVLRPGEKLDPEDFP